MQREHRELKEVTVAILAGIQKSFLQLRAVDLRIERRLGAHAAESCHGLIAIQEEIANLKAEANVQLTKLYTALDSLEGKLERTERKTSQLKSSTPCVFFAKGRCDREDRQFSHAEVTAKGKSKNKGQDKGETPRQRFEYHAPNGKLYVSTRPFSDMHLPWVSVQPPWRHAWPLNLLWLTSRPL